MVILPVSPNLSATLVPIINGIQKDVLFAVCRVIRIQEEGQKPSQESSELPNCSSIPSPIPDRTNLLRSHILRNHDESVRCRRCWSSFVGKPEALKEHAKSGDCIYKARPKGYWMNEYQTSYVRGQRFEGGGEEKWYHLFTVLLPHVKICDDQGNHLISPCRSTQAHSMEQNSSCQLIHHL